MVHIQWTKLRELLLCIIDMLFCAMKNYLERIKLMSNLDLLKVGTKVRRCHAFVSLKLNLLGLHLWRIWLCQQIHIWDLLMLSMREPLWWKFFSSFLFEPQVKRNQSTTNCLSLSEKIFSQLSMRTAMVATWNWTQFKSSIIGSLTAPLFKILFLISKTCLLTQRWVISQN